MKRYLVVCFSYGECYLVYLLRAKLWMYFLTIGQSRPGITIPTSAANLHLLFISKLMQFSSEKVFVCGQYIKICSFLTVN